MDDLVMVWTTAVRYDGGTLAFAIGETEEGHIVEYVGEPRALHAVSEALAGGEPAVLTAVPDWALLRRPAHLRRQAGQGLAEYALILALVAVVAIVALVFLGNEVSTALSAVGDAV